MHFFYVLTQQTETYIDILHIVAELRLDRGGMVHSVEEYDFVHKAVCMYSLAVAQGTISIFIA
jgi:receptor-type tyrosine-protein phosphatase R